MAKRISNEQLLIGGLVIGAAALGIGLLLEGSSRPRRRESRRPLQLPPRPRKVFFSFHYDDIWQVNQVKHSWVTQGESEGFFDFSLREVAKTHSEEEIAGMIDDALEGTDTTVVLIGEQTSERDWVDYEIVQSALRGNRLLGVEIHNLGDRRGFTTEAGENPFDKFTLEDGGLDRLGDHVPVHDWKLEDGYSNFAEWLRDAPTLEQIHASL